MSTRRLLVHLPLPIAVFVIGGCVAKWIDATAGVGICGLGTILIGRLFPQPRGMVNPKEGPE